MKKILLIISGFITLFLGVLGIFLPILPTTPFLLLSATCFVRSSIKLYNWLINHKILGIYIKSYLEYKAITIKTKVMSVSLLWIVMSITIIFFMDILWIRILLIIIAIGTTIHLLTMKTLTDEMKCYSNSPS